MSYPLARDTRKCSLLWHSFPEILAMQVSRLVSKIKEESRGGTESATRKELREKIATLSPSQSTHATDTLAMIWDGMMGSSDVPASKPKPSPFPPLPFLNWHKVKLALLRSIPTGIFIDVQFFAYNAICNGLPADPRPLYTSSIIIQRWEAAITTRKSRSCSKSAQF